MTPKASSTRLCNDRRPGCAGCSAVCSALVQRVGSRRRRRSSTRRKACLARSSVRRRALPTLARADSRRARRLAACCAAAERWRERPGGASPIRPSARIQLLRPAQRWRWPTSQPTTWGVAAGRSGSGCFRLRQGGSVSTGPGTRLAARTKLPWRFESWCLMISTVEGRSAGTSSTTDL